MKKMLKILFYFSIVIIISTLVFLNMVIIDRIESIQENFYLTNNTYNNKYNDLLANYYYTNEKLDRINNYYKYSTYYEDDSFNWLAIGNSLTLIDSWDRGICTTYPDNDYYGLLKTELSNNYLKTISYRYNFAIYEQLSHNERNKSLSFLDSFLSEKLNLIIIQLGENCKSIDYYEEDLNTLIDYIKDKSPNAKIVMIGDWWSKERNEIRKQVCLQNNMKFADLDEIINDPNYQSKTGNICYLSDGSTILVPENAATHPGDEGFMYIYNQVVSCLKQENIL